MNFLQYCFYSKRGISLRILLLRLMVTALFSMSVFAFTVSAAPVSTPLVFTPLTFSDSTLYAQAVEAFNRKEYRAVIALLEVDIQKGAVEYFDAESTELRLRLIAKAHFNVQNYVQAKGFFEELLWLEEARDTDLYGLAVIEKKLGNTKIAKLYFVELLKSHDELIRQSAEKQLQRIHVAGKNLDDESNLWSTLSIGVAYDDSIVDPVTDLIDESVNEGDSYTELSLGLFWQGAGRGESQWFANALLYSSRFSTVEDFNSNNLALGGGRKISINDQSSVAFSLDYERSTLGGDDYLSAWLPALKYSQRYSKALSWGTKVRFKTAQALSDEYAHLAGDSYRLELFTRYQMNAKNRFELKFRSDNDRRQASQWEQDGLQNSSDLSALRLGVDAQWQYNFSTSTALMTGLSFRNSRYLNDYVVNGNAIARNDDRLIASLELSHSVSSSLELSARIQRSDNQSSMDSFTYDQLSSALTLDFSF